MIDLELSITSLRDWLRQETRASHERTDEMFSRLRTVGAAGVKHFLTAHALAAPAIASRIHRKRDLPFATDFDPAPLTALLRRDLETLGAALPPPAPIDGLASPAECAGAAYTLAGSRLGAKVLANQWSSSPPATGFSSAYLNQENLFGGWREFCGHLNSLDDLEAERRLVLNGALAAFEHFQTAFAQAAEPCYAHA